MKKGITGGASSKVVLSDAAEKLKKDSVKLKRLAFSGKNFDTLKADEKDALLKAILEYHGWVNKAGVII